MLIEFLYKEIYAKLNNLLTLQDELNKFWNMIESNLNFTLLRYGDGERAIMQGRKVKAQEGWYFQGGESKLGNDLLATLSVTGKDLWHGISCPCCDRESYYWYISRILNTNITFSNLWVNNNHKTFIKKFMNLKRDTVVIANYRSEGKKIGNLNVLKTYLVSDDCISFWEKEAKKLLREIKKEFGERNNLLYVVSAGPMSEPIIIDLFGNNPNNCYIDFGSSIDKFIHNKETRPYMNANSQYSRKKCWMYNSNKVSFDVSVILTLYKRPETLSKQLAAIKSQSLKPKEIMLFQDGIEEDYKIEISSFLKKKFDNIKISEINVGVWARFKFAFEAKSPYICVFDDDTIPGHRWLENCHYHALQQKGIYGAIGIIMREPRGYPYKDYFRVGWASPFSKLMEVDFVGHSWFLRKEYLQYMFEETEAFQKHKYVGEDICLSVQAAKHGILTFVPPHPFNNKDLWGGDPEWSNYFGMSTVAISSSKDNYQKMQQIICDFESDGWIPLCKRNLEQVIQSKKMIRMERLKVRNKEILKAIKLKIRSLIKK